MYESVKAYLKLNVSDDVIFSTSVASLTASVTATLLGYPHDLIKSVKIIHEDKLGKSKGLYILKLVYRQNGWKGMIYG